MANPTILEIGTKWAGARVAMKIGCTRPAPDCVARLAHDLNDPIRDRRVEGFLSPEKLRRIRAQAGTARARGQGAGRAANQGLRGPAADRQ